MGSRRRAREIALKVIFEHEFTGQSFESIQDRMLLEEKASPDTAQFLQVLLKIVDDNLSQINEKIERQSNHWKLGRMASVDRNILRLGVAEILYFDEVPKSVTINEYLEIAKKFGTEESSSFVNGILDKLQKPSDK